MFQNFKECFMYEKMYKLDEVLKFFHDELNIKDGDKRITQLYNMIPNPFVRVNGNDKQWVAYVSQASEDKTVEDAMKEILKISDAKWLLGEQKKTKNIIDKVGKIFVDKRIKFKPRIPFYILVLNELVQ